MGEILIDWKDHDKALSATLWEYLQEEYLVDFNVTCHGKEKKVHKFVLAFLFPMLKESLRSNGIIPIDQQELTSDGSSGQSSNIPEAQCLNLNNIAEHPEDMDYLIQFAYTGKMAVPNEHADCLMQIADSMDIKSLKESLGQWNDNSKPKNDHNKIQQQNEDDCAKEKSSMNSVLRQNSIETPHIVIKTESDKEANDETHSREQATIQSAGARSIIGGPNITRLKQQLKTHDQKPSQNEPKGPKQFVCKICNEDLGSRSMLTKHRATNCGTELFPCKYCGHKTRRKVMLKQHIISVHQMDAEGNPLERNVKCPDCDYVCYGSHQLRIHKKAKHERLNMFKCKECKYAAPYKSELLRHERLKHQKIRDHMCDECGWRFMSNIDLNRHVLVRHKGLKPYKCNICNAEYSSPYSFKDHMNWHEGKVEYRFVCHICGHNLKRKCLLRDHMRNKHGMELEEAGIDPVQLQDACEPTST